MVGADGCPVCRSQWGKKGLGPVAHIDDTTFNHYALQVSLYRYILEKNYGIKAGHGYLGTFHPDYTRPYVVETPYLREEAEAVLALRKAKML